MSGVHTLLLRLEGPMQSWGYRSRFDYRDTALEPTRSAVIGLVCAAMGIARGESISRFDAIRMGARVERQGRVERDYHTALDVIRADGSGTDTVQSWRDYLADASFTVGLESHDRELLEKIVEALRAPVWPLFLGRKAFPVSVPPVHPTESVREGSLEDHLLRDEVQADEAAMRLSIVGICPERAAHGGMDRRVILEDIDGERTQHDWPLCFGERRFKPRALRTVFREKKGASG